MDEYPVIIENKRTYKGDGFYVGRPSPLGNPFVLRHESERGIVVAKYRDWLHEYYHTDEKVYNEFERIYEYYLRHGTVTLICWCAPKYCHAIVISEWLHARLARDMRSVEFPHGEFPNAYSYRE